MAISVTGLTVHTQTGLGTWQDYGAGGGSASNTVLYISSTGSRARKFTGPKGFAYEVNAAGTDLSNSIIVIRYILNGGFASTISAGGGLIRLEDTSGNQSDFYVDGSDTYAAGWKVVVIDTANTASANNGTAATMTAIQYVGMVVDAAAASGGDPNFYIDEVLSMPNTGLTLAGNTTNVFDEAATWDDTSKYGIITKREPVTYSKCPLILAPDVSDHASTDEIVIFEEPIYHDATNLDSALTLQGLSSSDADTLTFTRMTAICENNSSIGAGTNADKKLDFASATDIVCTDSKFRGFDGTTVALGGSGNDYTSTEFQECGKVTTTGAILRDIIFRATTDATGAFEWDENTDLQNSTFISGGTGHGAHFTHNSATNLTGASAIDLTNITWTGYGLVDTANAAIDVDPDTSSINVDFNQSGGTTPTLDKRSPYTGTAQVLTSVPIEVTVTFGGSPVEGAAVYLETTGAVEVLNGLTNASGVLSGTFSGTTPVNIDSNVSGVKASSGATPYEYFPLGGTISSTGYSATALLVED